MDPGWYYNRLPGQHVVGTTGESNHDYRLL